ncbi:PE family protein [Mycobacterium asiaticum]|uniref:PE domain-containing protein n=1 Tax=Mycobacterium asiaticum TaxID=1790 RepID=A0A1A3BK01_MYCAS|nr:PE family protein [Mycobacterium asiaticum]OBI74247.1 hypothetical protein A9X01_05765 [Mycobacterium asiaticum]
MSQVIVRPELMSAAAAELATIGSAIDEAHRALSPSIQAIAPAAVDEVSVCIARLFSEHAQEYRAAAQAAAAFQGDFVQNLIAGTGLYTNLDNVMAGLLRVWESEVSYYSTAGTALFNMVAWLPIQTLAFVTFPLFWPLLPLFPFLAMQNFATLFAEVLFRQPISYPYLQSPLVTLQLIQAMLTGVDPSGGAGIG